MIYKSFALVTLVAAPLLVLVAENFVPHASHPAPTPVPEPAPAAALPETLVPEAVPPAATDEASNFGQPMAEAGKPFLAPGAGLPSVSSAPAPVGEMSPPPAPDTVPE
ncbi:hypothetical protein [Sphingobium bisphenolivorans]|uniref:hypothetical protein n=1 Tax=Sphingobium bisphenolivorans TaxID=1335760 RepID=UPI000485834F|nr:hypothetical protein [Sphingobium bisphenolivorans]